MFTRDFITFATSSYILSLKINLWNKFKSANANKKDSKLSAEVALQADITKIWICFLIEQKLIQLLNEFWWQISTYLFLRCQIDQINRTINAIFYYQ